MDCWYLPRGLDAPALRDNPGGFVTSDTAVLDTLVDLTAVSVDHSSLPVSYTHLTLPTNREV